MPDYKEMYFKLFAAMADAHEILEKAMQEAEEMYIRDDKNNIIDLKITEKKK